MAGPAPDPRQAALRKLIDPDSGEVLDEALVLRFDAPSSFTGEDVVELYVHGGPAVVEGVLNALGRISGLRAAVAGEFARRAFDNDKLDLTEVEGLADLIEAETQAQRRQALRQSGGDLRALCDEWRAQIIHASSLVEAALDFSDEADVPDLVERQARAVVDELVSGLSGHLESAGKGERLREGLQVVLAGAPNAGKSSLLNALSQRDVAIVSHEPGTTRDLIEVHLDLGGYPVTLIDTAGLREATGDIELEGMRRTRERARSADLVMWLVDAGDPQWEPPDTLSDTGGILNVLNKIDLGVPENSPSRDVLEISAKTGAGLDDLVTRLAAHAARSMDAGEPAVVTRSRQRLELETCREALQAFLSGDAAQLELRAEDLRVAARALGRLSGRVDVEDVLDRIFGDFCIGK
jgi:tRNA modification GTPase